MKDSGHYLFYSSAIDGDRVVLDGDETRHALTVLHIKKGDRFTVTKGSGTICECVFNDVVKGELTGTIINSKSVVRIEPSIRCAVGLPERDAFERIVESATALGVKTIIPVVSRFCQKPWWEKDWGKLASRFARISVASMKQCRNPYMPIIVAPQELESWIASIEQASGQEDVIITADPEGDSPGSLQKQLLPGRRITLFIGPPGGLADEEKEQLRSRNSLFMKLAPHRLRTELAAVVGCALVRGWFI
jgi:16S rRNA (uracil1498-N3)-methyltransferase